MKYVDPVIFQETETCKVRLVGDWSNPPKLTTSAFSSPLRGQKVISCRLSEDVAPLKVLEC